MMNTFTKKCKISVRYVLLFFASAPVDAYLTKHQFTSQMHLHCFSIVDHLLPLHKYLMFVKFRIIHIDITSIIHLCTLTDYGSEPASSIKKKTDLHTSMYQVPTQTSLGSLLYYQNQESFYLPYILFIKTCCWLFATVFSHYILRQGRF